MESTEKLKKKHLSTEQVEFINTTLASLEKVFDDSFSNLTGNERRQYGNVCEQNKLLIYKVGEYAANQPELRSPNVNWDEFAKDFTSRIVLEGFIARLQILLDGIGNAKSLYDYDNYQAAMDDFGYAKHKKYIEKYKDLNNFFCRISNPGIVD